MPALPLAEQAQICQRLFGATLKRAQVPSLRLAIKNSLAGTATPDDVFRIRQLLKMAAVEERGVRQRMAVRALGASLKAAQHDSR